MHLISNEYMFVNYLHMFSRTVQCRPAPCSLGIIWFVPTLNGARPTQRCASLHSSAKYIRKINWDIN